MAKLSPARLSTPILEGLELINRGKVRDTYRLPPLRRLEEKLGKLLLVVASDGISIFDFVLNTMIPYKGYVLNAITHFWLTYLEGTGVKTHFIATGADIDQYLPENLRGNVDLQRRAMVVMELDMIPVEFIARFCLTGSVLKEYQAHGTVYGKEMTIGLKDGDLLPEVQFTPTTKASEGHDEPMDADSVREKYRSETAVFLTACERCVPHANKRKIIVADTKGELGYDKKRIIRIGDEWFTPDSSRFWDAMEHTTSRTKPLRSAPQPHDKQIMRAVGIEHGINKLNPLEREDVEKAHKLFIPASAVISTAQTYLNVFTRLTGLTLESYARERLNISL